MQVLWHVTMICNILTINTYNFLGGSPTANLTLHIIKRSSEEIIGNACYSFVSTTLLWTHTLKFSFSFFSSLERMQHSLSPSARAHSLLFSLFVCLPTHLPNLLVGLQVNGMHTKRKRKGAYKEQEKTQRAKTNRFPLKLTLDKLNLLACLLPSSLVLNMQLCRIATKNKSETLFVWGIEFTLTLV